MQLLFIATSNPGKTAEFRSLLGHAFEVRDLSALPPYPAPIESGATFQENALIKALDASSRFPGLVLADDSGLEVDCLRGAPGVRSARYAGEHASDSENVARLIAEMEKTGARGPARSARFRCVLALAGQGRVISTFDGAVEGIIANRPKGGSGFGYDPVFIPDGFCQTFAELGPAVKNNLSHRARAVANFLAAFPSCQEISGP